MPQSPFGSVTWVPSAGIILEAGRPFCRSHPFQKCEFIGPRFARASLRLLLLGGSYEAYSDVSSSSSRFPFDVASACASAGPGLSARWCVESQQPVAQRSSDRRDSNSSNDDVMGHVLIVDDDPAFRQMMTEYFVHPPHSPTSRDSST